MRTRTRSSARWAVGLAAVLLAPCQALAQGVTLAHADWEMYRAPRVRLPSPGTTHGDPTLYRYAPAIPGPGGDWTALTASGSDPRNPTDINYLGPNDDYSSDLRSCLTELEFTYFQSSVSLPAGFTVRLASVSLGPLDDGARVLVINSAHPGGAVPEGGYVLIGDSRAVDVAALLRPGEVNRIVVEHMDDCGGQSWLGTVTLEVQGEASANAPRYSWGRLKSMYR